MHDLTRFHLLFKIVFYFKIFNLSTSFSLDGIKAVLVEAIHLQAPMLSEKIHIALVG